MTWIQKPTDSHIGWHLLLDSTIHVSAIHLFYPLCCCYIQLVFCFLDSFSALILLFSVALTWFFSSILSLPQRFCSTRWWFCSHDVSIFFHYGTLLFSIPHSYTHMCLASASITELCCGSITFNRATIYVIVSYFLATLCYYQSKQTGGIFLSNFYLLSCMLEQCKQWPMTISRALNKYWDEYGMHWYWKRNMVVWHTETEWEGDSEIESQSFDWDCWQMNATQHIKWKFQNKEN